MSVKVRIAPSPTGNLHIGTARAALFNWLFARRHAGQFILRLEDTDLERSKPEYERNIVDGLRWLGLSWDNERMYRQSERTSLYRSYLERLLADGKASVRTYTDEEKEAIAKEGREPRDSIIVLNAPDPRRDISFDDVIRGTVSVKGEHVGSLVMAKDLDTPLYNFTVVVDDIDMDISHVIRGEDHISNTPKQLLIYEALRAAPPVFAHLPLILGTDRSKLSKRHGATSIAEYQNDYLPDALVNFIGFLGYTYDREFLSMKEMAEHFELEKVHKGGAAFDVAKLDWMNAKYIKKLSPQAFKALIGRPELPDSAVEIMTERLERLTQAQEFSFFWDEPEYPARLLSWRDDDPDVALRSLTMAAELAARGALTGDNMDRIASEHFGGKKGSVYWPLRVALSGRDRSPGPLDIAAVIGPESTQARIRTALEKLRP